MLILALTNHSHLRYVLILSIINNLAMTKSGNHNTKNNSYLNNENAYDYNYPASTSAQAVEGLAIAQHDNVVSGILEELKKIYEGQPTLPEKGKKVELTTFKNKPLSQNISDGLIKPALFTGLATFASWQLFGKVVLPYAAETFINNFGEYFGVKDAKNFPGQAFVGTALSTQIVLAFGMVDTIKCLYDSAGKNFGWHNEKTDSLIKEALNKNQKDLEDRIRKGCKDKEITTEEGKQLLKNFDGAFAKFWNHKLTGRFRNMAFQGLEDATAGAAEGSHKFAFGEKFEEFRDNNIGSIASWAPETARDMYNFATQNPTASKVAQEIAPKKLTNLYGAFGTNTKIQDIGKTTIVDDRPYIDRLADIFYDAKDPIVENAKKYLAKAIVAIPRGLMRGAHFPVAEKLLELSGGSRGEILVEALYQGSRNGLFQQFFWQVGHLGVQIGLDKLIFQKNPIKENEFFIEELQPKHAIFNMDESAHDIDVDIIIDKPTTIFKKQDVTDGLLSLKDDLHKMKKIVSKLQDVDQYYPQKLISGLNRNTESKISNQSDRIIEMQNIDKIIQESNHSSEENITLKIDEEPNPNSKLHLEQILDYEEKLSTKPLTDSEKKTIAFNVNELCKGAKEAYQLYDMIIDSSITKINGSKNEEEIVDIFDMCENINIQARERFSMLFPTGLIDDKTFTKIGISNDKIFDRIKNNFDRNPPSINSEISYAAQPSLQSQTNNLNMIDDQLESGFLLSNNTTMSVECEFYPLTKNIPKTVFIVDEMPFKKDRRKSTSHNSETLPIKNAPVEENYGESHPLVVDGESKNPIYKISEIEDDTKNSAKKSQPSNSPTTKNSKSPPSKLDGQFKQNGWDLL